VADGRKEEQPVINKIIAIKNIGRFVDYSCSGDVEFRKFTLIFGENGRGKTMLSAIIRSLETGKAGYLLERKAIKSTAPPEVLVRVNDANHSFKNGAWDVAAPGIHVFDTTFVNENVYSGAYVQLEHKRSLYKFIVGQKGVQLATAVDDCDAQIRVKNKEIKEKETEITAYILGAQTVDAFAKVLPVHDVDKRITEKTAEVSALKEATTIASKPQLTKLTVPTFSMDGFEPLLLKTLEDVAGNAEKLTRDHIAGCMDKQGEAWVDKGLAYIKGDRCPFCGQPLAGVELIKAYRAFFSASYKGLEEEINQAHERANAQFSQEAIIRVQSVISSNFSSAEFWKKHLAFEDPTIEFEVVKQGWTNLHGLVEAYLRRKEASPLEKILLGDDIKHAFEAYAKLIENVAKYSEAVDAANGLITQKKQKTASGNLAAEEAQLIELRNAKKRHEDAPVKKLCDDYLKLKQEKDQLDTDKSKAKQDLETYADKILVKNEKAINQQLANFGAGFRLCNAGTTYPGGKPTADYQLSINGTPVSLGDAKPGQSSPCFGNTLSAGDKSTLAFAFFIACLNDDPNLSGAIVFLDDPISSLDANRKDCTQQAICKLGTKAKQVVVLSHDPHFLLSIWNEEKQPHVKTLQIARKGQDSIVEEWDIEKATRDSYLQDYFALDDYVATGASSDLRSTARRIRPLLEGNLRLRFPKSFCRNEWLGEFIKKIRDCGPSDDLDALKPRLSELEDINNYSKKYHHEQNPTGCDTEPLIDAALLAYAKRALKFVSGT
jgi:wobble nucleotide-excising tRNase